jgi:hypothetical protein
LGNRKVVASSETHQLKMFFNSITIITEIIVSFSALKDKEIEVT